MVAVFNYVQSQPHTFQFIENLYLVKTLTDKSGINPVTWLMSVLMI